MLDRFLKGITILKLFEQKRYLISQTLPLAFTEERARLFLARITVASAMAQYIGLLSDRRYISRHIYKAGRPVKRTSGSWQAKAAVSATRDLQWRPGRSRQNNCKMMEGS